MTMARPSAIRTRCCLNWCRRVGGESPRSDLDEEFHLHAGQLDQIVVLERMRSGADCIAVDRRMHGTLDVGNEVALRAPGQDGNLNARFPERSERLGQLELFPG